MRLSGFIFDGIAIGLALLVKFATPDPDWIEAHYSNGVYPPIDAAVRAVTSPLPFTLGDVLFAGLLIALVLWWGEACEGLEPAGASPQRRA